MAKSKTKTILATGFISIVALMVILTVISIAAHRSSLKRIEAIVNTNNIKTYHLTQMRTLARERTVSMQKMLILTDPFERDEEWLRFKSHAGKFISVRQQLVSMELSVTEKQLMDVLSNLTNKIGLLQNSIVDLILEEKIEAARSLLITTAMPGQDSVFNHMSEMLQHLKAEADHAVAEAKKEFQRTVAMLIVIAICAISASIIISFLLVRRTSNTEQQLFREKERAQITLYSIGDGVITTDVQGNIEHMNSAAEALTGWTNSSAISHELKNVFCLLPDKNQNSLNTIFTHVLNKGHVATSSEDTLLQDREGNEIAIEFSLAPIFSANRTVTGTILIFRDVSELRAMSKQLEYYAKHDSLTGLLNRREFEVHLDAALHDIRRHPDREYWLCYIDLDQFKVVNDTCGHLAGDELLKQFSNILIHELRKCDRIARLGGDEFAVISSDCDERAALNTFERVRKIFQDNGFCWSDKCFTVTASFGLVPISPESGSLYDIMSVVDTACYIAKDEGRNRIHMVQQGDEASINRKNEMDWVHRIHSALDENRFDLYFQTIKSLHSKQTACHAEILVRMRDDTGKLIPPNAFIPSAERYNLMELVDRWIVKNTLEFLRTAPLDSPLISINLSAQSLCAPDFMNFVVGEIDRQQIDPSWLCFEITETSAIANLTHAQRFMSVLKGVGCRFSLDDFGSGLSSFAYLKNLAIDYLKIDGTFIKNIHNDRTDYAMVSSIHQVGHVMGIQTIAEYVENEEIETTLRTIGIDFAQGYGIDRPAPLSEMAAKDYWQPMESRNKKLA